MYRGVSRNGIVGVDGMSREVGVEMYADTLMGVVELVGIGLDTVGAGGCETGSVGFGVLFFQTSL